MSNDETLWLQSTLGETANNRAAQAVAAIGKALPCVVTAVHYPGPLVTVAFELISPTWTLQPVTIPVAMAQWARLPVQVGDLGVAASADAFLGGIAGVGPKAVLGATNGNLGSLFFVPIATTTFSAPPTNEFWGNGPDGGRIGDDQNTCYVDADANGETISLVCGTNVSITLSTTAISLVVGSKSWSFSASGLTDSLGVVEETHIHGGVTSGASDTTGPLSG